MASGYDPMNKRMKYNDNGYGNFPGRRQNEGFGGSSGNYGGMSSGMHQGTFHNYSPAQSKPRPGNTEEKPNNVLLFTVFNPKYPITVDVMHTICSPNGTVNRIVVFRKNGVQSMVEFDSIEEAGKAKEALNGADIYSGCCTLKVDWGKPTRLNVMKNDQDSWDYTVPNLGKEPKGQPLLPDPKFDPNVGSGPHYGPLPPDMSRRGLPAPMEDFGYDGYGRQDPMYEPRRRTPQDRFPGPSQDSYYGPPPHRNPFEPQPPLHMDNVRGGYGELPGGSQGMLQQGAVLMVYGMNKEKMNCQKVFNLFCLYGNVVRVKFLKSKEGSAMIQMGDQLSCERVMKNLNGVHYYGSKMTVAVSKQAFIQDVPNPANLEDGTPSFMDFMGSRNNRFSTPEAAAKNRIVLPSNVAYFFNSPPKLKEDDVCKVFTDKKVKAPAKVKIFPSKTERSSTGLVEWDSKSDCVEALVVCNHTQMPNPNGKAPFILKLCFSGHPINEMV